MTDLLIAINTTVLLFLSFLHLYLAVGGTLAKESALPCKLNGELAVNLSDFGTFIVRLGLIFSALIMVSNTGVFDPWIDRDYLHTATIIVSVIFFIRAIGDFKYVELVKSIKTTEFAKKDSVIYAPLCLVISLFSLLIIIFIRWN